MPRIAYPLLPVLLILLAVGCGRDTPQTGGPLALPPETPVVADLAAATIDGPFMRLAASGDEPARLILHKGEGTGKGLIHVDLDVPTAGDYRVWLRARWRDTCGNSCTVAVPGLPPMIAGEDAVYEVWHWVSVGPVPLDAGTQRITIGEREDGIELDQILLASDRNYRPSGRVSTAPTAPVAAAPTQPAAPMPPIPDASAADDFNRSAGHGLGAWNVASGTWELTFSFDPNRVPLQYALSGAATPEDGDGIALIDADPWLTCRLEFAVQPVDAQVVGAVLDHGSDRPIRVAFQADGALVVAIGDRVQAIPLGDSWRLGQWHRVVIDRRADSLSVALDGTHLVTIADTRAQTGAVGLLVATGQAAFDDVSAGSGTFAVDRVPPYIIGPYDFQSTQLEDPSDYLDFTDEEWAAMKASPDADKLRREPRQNMRVIGPGNQETAAWRYFHGSWTIAAGALTGKGPNSLLEHVGGFDTSGELRLRVRLPQDDAAAMIGIYGEDTPLQPTGPGRVWTRKGDAIPRPEIPPFLTPAEGAVVIITRGTTRLPEGDAPGLVLRALTDGEWHDLRLQFSDDRITASIDGGAPVTAAFTRSHGTTLRLGVLQGLGDFDNVEVRLPRRTERDWLHAFDLRNTGWWREGQWVDHSGIACVLASDWTSLIATETPGRMRHKSLVGNHVRISVGVEENSEWFGWSAKHSHQHYPFDNVQVGLVDPATDDGYILTVNTEDHHHATLTRNGEQVAHVQQPPASQRFTGGHSPYSPRRLHVTLERRGGDIVARLNGHDLLTYTDPEPLTTPQPIVGGFKTRFNVARVDIHDLTAPAAD